MLYCSFPSITYFIVSPSLPGWLRALVALIPGVRPLAVLIVFVPKDVVVRGHAEVVVLLDEQLDLRIERDTDEQAFAAGQFSTRRRHMTSELLKVQTMSSFSVTCVSL